MGDMHLTLHTPLAEFFEAKLAHTHAMFFTTAHLWLLGCYISCPDLHSSFSAGDVIGSRAACM